MLCSTLEGLVSVCVITHNWSELVWFCTLEVYPVDVVVVFVYVPQ